MKINTFLILLILTACIDRAADDPIEKLTLSEIEQRINGAWKLKTFMTQNHTTQFDINTDTLTCFQFDELKGSQFTLIDNYDNTYATRSDEPICELKEKNGKKIIEFGLIFNDNWEEEIKSLSNEEMVLADSLRTWIYIRQEIEGFQ